MALKKHISLFKSIKQVIDEARQEVVRTTNMKMVTAYFLIGKSIVEYEQAGQSKATYAGFTLQLLSDYLTEEYGRGFSVDNLENMRRFYLAYSISEKSSRKLKQAQQGFQPKNDKKDNKKTDKKQSNSISEKSSRKLQNGSPVFTLSFSHYVMLSRIDNIEERNFYEIESTKENWSLEELKRQYNSSLYERLALSRNKKKVKELSQQGHVVSTAADAVKDPYVLEFLGLKHHHTYSENDLENAIIGNLENFLSELGKGFLFVDRQYRIGIEEEHYFVDLVFYHRILRCFILIDLKLGDLKAADLGQMQLYVGYFDEAVKEQNENSTIGIVLCKNKKESIVRYTLPKDNKQIFTSKYKMYLPDKKDLQQLMEPGLPLKKRK